MTVIIGEAAKKNTYWTNRVHERLGSAFDSLIPALKDMKEWAKNTDIDQEKLQGAFMIISHGFDQAQKVIHHEPDVVFDKLEVKGDDQNGRTNSESSTPEKQ